MALTRRADVIIIELFSKVIGGCGDGCSEIRQGRLGDTCSPHGMHVIGRRNDMEVGLPACTDRRGEASIADGPASGASGLGGTESLLCDFLRPDSTM